MSSLEYYSLFYLDYAENFSLYHYPLVLLGAAAAGILQSVDYRMQRATFFLNVMFAIFIAVIAQSVWLLGVKALANGFLPLLVIFDVIVWIALGYFLALVSKARSLDAYDTTAFAFLAFIPFANLWLLFKPSLGPHPEKRGYLYTGVAVAIGLALMIAGKIGGKIIEEEIENNTTLNITETEGKNIRDKYFLFFAKKEGLTKALEYLATLDEVGFKLDEITLLEDIYVRENILTYKYKILDNDVTNLDLEWQIDLQNSICNDYEYVIGSGATIEFLYTSDFQDVIASVKSSQSICQR